MGKEQKMDSPMLWNRRTLFALLWNRRTLFTLLWHRRILFALLLSSCALGLFPVSEGCVPQSVCQQDINDLVVDTNDLQCNTRCECNNQRFEGLCVDHQCQASLRSHCPSRGQWEPCQIPHLSPKRTGWRECQPRALFRQVWGDCRSDISPPEDSTEPTEFSFENREKEKPAEDQHPDKKSLENSQEPTENNQDSGSTDENPKTEFKPKENVAENSNPCGPKELCGDGKDNNCDGQIDEGCAPCPPSRLYRRLVGHSDTIHSSSVSPNRKLYATASADGSVIIRNIQTGTVQRIIRAQEAFTSVTFHPDGTHLVTGNSKGVVGIWDLFSGNPRPSIPAQTESIQALSIDPTGKYLALVVKGAWKVQLWDWKSLTQLGTTPTGRKRIKPNLQCPLCDASTTCFQGKCWEVDAKLGHTGEIRSLAFDFQGKMFATGGNDRTIRLWNVQTLQLSKTFKGQANAPGQLAFHPNGKNVVAIHPSDQTTLRFWDIATGSVQKIPITHSGGIISFAFDRLGQQLATASLDHSIKTWNQAFQFQKTLLGHTTTLTSMVFLSSSQLLSTSQRGSLRIWEYQTGTQTKHILGHKKSLTALSSHPSRALLATSSLDQTAHVWNLLTGSLLIVLKGHISGLVKVAFSPDGRQIATASQDGTIRLWDGNSYQYLQEIKAYPSLNLTGFAYHPQAKGFATIGDGKAVTTLWDSQGKSLQKLEQKQITADRRWAVQYGPNGKWLAILASHQTQSNKFIELWDIQSTPAKLQIVLKNVQSSPKSLTFSPNGSILTSHNDTQTQLWDLRTFQVYQTFPGTSQAIAWGPQGRLLAFAQVGSLALWDLQRSRLLLRQPTAFDANALVFLQGGKQLVASFPNRDILVWGCTCSKPGKQVLCYGGPADSVGIGPCQKGHSLCTNKGITAPCQGAILPKTEQPDGIDNNCDGVLDESFVDLSISSLSVEQTKLVPGSTFTIKVCVNNQGHFQSLTSQTSVRLYFSEDAILQTTDIALTGQKAQPADLIFSKLRGGQSGICKSLRIKLPVQTKKGKAYIGALVDFQQKYLERDETNNGKSLRIEVVQ